MTTKANGTGTGTHKYAIVLGSTEVMQKHPEVTCSDTMVPTKSRKLLGRFPRHSRETGEQAHSRAHFRNGG
ncbi:hypothetical protein D9M68_384850 [compost metagenome]